MKTKEHYINEYTEECTDHIYELLTKAMKKLDSYEELKELEETLLTIADVGIDFFDELLDKTKIEEYEIAYAADLPETLNALDLEFDEQVRE